MTVMFARPPASGVTGQQQSVPFHQPVDALGVDRGQTIGSPLAPDERGDSPVPVGWPRVDEATDRGRQFKITVAGLARVWGGCP